MILLLEIEELVPLIEAIAKENHRDTLVPPSPFQEGTVYEEVSLLLESHFGLDNHPDIPESHYLHLEMTGFSIEGIRIKDAIDRLIRTMYPSGVLMSIEVLNSFGTVLIHFNPGTLKHARHHPQFRQYR